MENTIGNMAVIKQPKQKVEVAKATPEVVSEQVTATSVTAQLEAITKSLQAMEIQRQQDNQRWSERYAALSTGRSRTSATAAVTAVESPVEDMRAFAEEQIAHKNSFRNGINLLSFHKQIGKLFVIATLDQTGKPKWYSVYNKTNNNKLVVSKLFAFKHGKIVRRKSK